MDFVRWRCLLIFECKLLVILGVFLTSFVKQDWFKYAVYNDSTYSFDNFGVPDIEYADTIDPGVL